MTVALAYSYIRLSSVEQRKGKGEQRQLEAAHAYADKHGLKLDDSLRDLGKSGYKGTHIKSGALGIFLDLVANGKVPVGSFLIVENLDRLSRQTPIDAQAQFIALLQAGIKIVTLMDGQVYERGRDFTQMIISLTIMSRGHEESARKSYNNKKSREIIRKEMLEGKPRFHLGLEKWIDQTRVEGSRDYTFALNENVKTVRKIFELADKGVGSLSIARFLNENDYPTLRGDSKRWWDITVHRILRKEVAIGTLQVVEPINGKTVNVGEPIKGYYPAAVSEELFWRVQTKLAANKGPKKGAKGTRYANLFQGLCKCIHCGARVKLTTSSDKNRVYYRCDNRYLENSCDSPSVLFPYKPLEETFLDNVTDFYLDSCLARDKTHTDSRAIELELSQLQTTLAGVEARRRNVLAMSELAEDPEDQASYVARLREMRVEIETARAQIKAHETTLRENSERAAELVSVTDMIAEERKTWKTASAEDVFVSRSKVAQAIRNFVSDVYVNFEAQTVNFNIAGVAKAYYFDRDGGHLYTWDAVSWPAAQLEQALRLQGKSDAEIATAVEAIAKLQSQ